MMHWQQRAIGRRKRSRVSPEKTKLVLLPKCKKRRKWDFQNWMYTANVETISYGAIKSMKHLIIYQWWDASSILTINISLRTFSYNFHKHTFFLKILTDSRCWCLTSKTQLPFHVNMGLSALQNLYKTFVLNILLDIKCKKL